MRHTSGPWSQGITLLTQITRKWSSAEMARNDAREKLAVFSNFSANDQGRGRRLVAKCETHEDARLVSAAPDLLEAAKGALVALSRTKGNDLYTERLEYAIRKAEGK